VLALQDAGFHSFFRGALIECLRTQDTRSARFAGLHGRSNISEWREVETMKEIQTAAHHPKCAVYDTLSFQHMLY
jgi:hypothetical protein